MHAPVIIVLVKGREHVIELANSLYLKLIGKDLTIIGKLCV